MENTTFERARALLALPRIALVGASRSPHDLSRAVLRELARRGHDVVPVNPSADALEGRRCFARVSDVSPPVQGAIVMTPPARTAEVVRDCLDAGVTALWLHRGGGPGAASAEAIALCRSRGVEPVTDLCPFMVMEGAGWLHRLHAAFRRRALRRATGAAVDGA